MSDGVYLKGRDALASVEQGSRSDGATVISLIRRAIRERRVVEIEYNGEDRVIEPHRLWQLDNGSYMIEAFQSAGASAWGAAGDDGESPGTFQLDLDFERSPLEERPADPVERAKIMPEDADDSSGPTAMPKRNFLGWLSFLAGKLRRVILGRARFDVRPDFNPDPTRRPGRVEAQVVV